MRQGTLIPDTDSESGRLNVVFARFQESQPFSFDLFEGFNSLRTLTYSASISMTVRMLHRFEYVECVFGYEGVIGDFGTMLAAQKDISQQILMAVKSLADERKALILERTAKGTASFFVLKDAVSHSKIYLLEGDGRRRVIVGSANFSERAFSGKQAETLVVFDDDNQAFQHYEREYETVRKGASSEFKLPDLAKTEVSIEEIPVLQDAEKTENGVGVLLISDVGKATVPEVVRRVEKLGASYNAVTSPLVKPFRGEYRVDRKIMGQITQLVRSQRGKEAIEEPRWLSIDLEARTALLSGKEISLETRPDEVKSDARCVIEYFGNFEKGFLGDVDRHQRDYFMFMSWFYLTPFICDLRNHAIAKHEFIFDFPMFAVLFGKSNCGKTRLMETIMKSMFGQWDFVDKDQFTTSILRGLLRTRKRFPVIFDDVDQKRFSAHGSNATKDELFMQREYPSFVLSMNAENHSFSTEIIKRCLMIYTASSLPENSELSRELYKSVASIQDRISTALYREYLRRVLERFSAEDFPRDMLKFSSEVLVGLLGEAHDGPLPAWCEPMSIDDYQGKKYEKVINDLTKMYELNPGIWDVRKDEVILRVQPFEFSGLRKDIPDWILRPGSKAGSLILDRQSLEAFLGVKIKPGWRRRLRM